MKIKVLKTQIELPQIHSELAAGVDLKVENFKSVYKGNKLVDIASFKHSIGNGYIMLRGFERVLCGTGLFLEIPQGYYLAIVDRSGNALKKGILVANSPGTIDADYRDEVGIILYNSTPYLNKINIGDRLCQAILLKHESITWDIVDKLSDVDRHGGFGHTGK